MLLFGRAAGPPNLTELPAVFTDARRNLALRTFFLTRALMGHMSLVAEALQELLGVVAAGHLRMPITEFRLEEAGQAQHLLESGASVGKIILRP